MLGTQVAIFNSRQGRCPSGSQLWLRQTEAALDWVKATGAVLLSSIGCTTWDALTCRAAARGIPIRLVPAQSSPHGASFNRLLSSQYALQPDQCEMVEELSLTGGSLHSSPARRRDARIAELADLILPISIRAGGWLAHVLKENSSNRAKLDARFCIPYQRAVDNIAYRPACLPVPPELNDLPILWHYTRGTQGPWPDESLFQYWHDIVHAPVYPRSAAATLRRIVSSGRLQASSRHTVQEQPVVSFTTNPPHRMLPLMRWRARYGEMAFEPYAIGVPLDEAARLGIRRVQYVDRSHQRCSAERWLQQPVGRSTDWRAECEYRHAGDFDLRRIDNRAIVLVTRFTEEAKQLETDFGIRAIGLAPMREEFHHVRT